MARTVSQYFNQTGAKNEQRMVEDLIVESIRINGLQVLYVPKTLVAFDSLFGEDPQMAFKLTFPIEMYFDNPTGFEGDKEIIAKLGVELREKANFICSRRRFNQVVRYDGTTVIPQTIYQEKEFRPMEGDLIYLPVTNDLYSIQYADHESVFHQLGGLYIWRITVEKWPYSHEAMQTGVPEIDRVQQVFDGPTGFETDTFDNETFIIDTDQDRIADNEELKKEGTRIIDFSEDNPFGEPDHDGQ